MNTKDEIVGIANSIKSINASHFLLSIDNYLRFAALVDDSLLFPGGAPGKDTQPRLHEKYEAVYADISREASDLHSRSRKSRTGITNYRFKLNGRATGKPVVDGNTEAYFYKIKRHQMELLFHISDRVAIMESMLEQVRRMQAILLANRPAIKASSRMMDVMKERMAKRPSTLLQLKGEGESVKQLNLTFRDMDDFEKDREKEFSRKEKIEKKGAFSFYHGLVEETYEQVKLMGEDVRKNVKELKYGLKFFRRLATKGYSPRIQKKLNKLVENHAHRSRKFKEDVLESRDLFFS